MRRRDHPHLYALCRWGPNVASIAIGAGAVVYYIFLSVTL